LSGIPTAGPIDAITGVSVELESYKLEGVTEGIEALATTRVSIAPRTGGPNNSPSLEAQSGISRNRKFSGSGSDTDIIMSSARAYTPALNKLLMWNMRCTRRDIGEDEDTNGASAGDATELASNMEVVGEVSP